ncbi:MAG: carboxypeptidase regulatory-like domain-containing protein [Acidobacteriota bacterium]
MRQISTQRPATVQRGLVESHHFILFSLLGCLMLLCQVTARGQVTTADVVGSVTDNTGAVLPNARVTITNLGTNTTRVGETNAGGEYVFNLLPIGQYSIRIETSGFKVFTATNLTLVAGDRTRVDAKMEIGATTEVVNVTVEANVLQTDTSTIGTAITGRLVQELPLNGRNYVQLALLVPGVSPGPPNGLATGTRPDDRRLSSSYSVNGQDPVVNNNMIDGMDNNERVIGTIGVRPSIDAIQEFKVQTNLYSAEVSRTSGGVVNIITKSGTNDFHGTLFEFLRNDKFDANGNYNFTGGATLPKQKFRQNQYGGSIGGPIRRDRTFFFGDYEALTIRQGLGITATIPTARQRVGDFSQNCTAGFNAEGICSNPAQQISFINPLGNAPAGPVPFNRLDQGVYAALRDPVALKFGALLPLPTGPGINTVNYASSPVRTQDASTFDARIDHRLNDKMNLFGRYSYNDVTTLQPPGFPAAANGTNPGGVFSFAGPNESRAQNIQLNLVRTIWPNLLLELRTGYTRVAIQSKTINDGKNSANDLGFPCNAVSCVNIGDEQTYGLPRVVIQGFQDLGDAWFVPLLNFSNTFQYNGALTWTRNAHNIKIGGLLIRRQFSFTQSRSGRGGFTFNAHANNAPAPLNFGMANFIVGAPVAIERVTSLYKPGYRTWETGAFIQDDWRVNKWLTLNLGLRYDLFTAKTEQHNRLSNFDPLTATILAAGENSDAAVGIRNDYTNLAPRFGFAATIASGTVLRGGIGWSFFPGDYASNGLLKNAPFTAAFTCGTSTTGSLTNTGCPAGTGSFAQGAPRPVDPSAFPRVNGALNLAAIIPSTIGAMDLDFKSSYNIQFNLTLERQFGDNLVSIAYIGTQGRRMAMAIPDINRALPSGTATPNPRPYATRAPRVTTIGYLTPSGNASYNALQISYNRRFSRGFSATSGFTWAHGIDEVTGLGTSTGGYGMFAGPFDQVVANVKRYDRATSDFNIKYRWSFGGNYEIPWGRNLKGLAGHALGGWQANGTVTWQTGLPFTVTNQQNVSGVIGGGGERPNRLREELRVAKPTVGVAGQFLDPAAFALPANFTLGNSSRNQGYGPNQSVINASIFKTFVLREGLDLQFRTEMFNVPNHPVFGNPNTQFGNPNYGKITSTAGVYTPRQTQFALKLLF